MTCSYKDDMEPDELFEVVSQCLLSSVDRDAYSGWGAVVYIIMPDKIIERRLKTRMDYVCLLRNTGVGLVVVGRVRCLLQVELGVIDETHAVQSSWQSGLTTPGRTGRHMPACPYCTVLPQFYSMNCPSLTLLQFGVKRLARRRHCQCVHTDGTEVARCSVQVKVGIQKVEGSSDDR